MELKQIIKAESIELANTYYIYYSCLAEDTIENFLTALDFRELYGELTNDKGIIREVTQTRVNFARNQELQIDKKVC